MFNTCRFGMRILASNIRRTAQKRLISSKEMLTKPGTTCCDVDFKKSEVCKSKKERMPKKTIGPFRKPQLECMEEPCCPDPPVKYDEEFKSLLAHKERVNFQKTWRECPPRRVIQKIVCSEPTPEEKCPRIEVKKKCEPEKCVKQDPRCVKILMPGCKAVQVHANCKKYPHPANCVKIQCPYPSFSECAKPKPKPRHPTECGCLSLRSMCEIMRMMQGRKVKGGKGKRKGKGKAKKRA